MSQKTAYITIPVVDCEAINNPTTTTHSTGHTTTDHTITHTPSHTILIHTPTTTIDDDCNCAKSNVNTNNDTEKKNFTTTTTTHSTFRIICIVSFNIAINFGWNSFFNLATPLFATLGVPAFWISFATISGPVCGFLQPFIGVLSDNCTSRFGRRRPFILGGLITGVVGMLLFANSEMIGAHTSSSVAIFIAVASLWVTHIGFNIIQAAGCGLMLDVCQTDSQLDVATAACSGLNGLAGILAASVGFVNFEKYFHNLTNIEGVFYVGVFLVVASILPTLFAASEKVYVPQTNTTILSSLKEMIIEIKNMNKAVVRLFMLVLLTAMIQYPWSLYFTHYMAHDIYKGDPSAPEGSRQKEQYEAGVRVGSLITGVMDCFTLICALPLSSLVPLVGHKGLYFIGNMWGIVGYGFPAIPGLYTFEPAVGLAVSTGLFQATTNSLQWTLLGLSIDESKSGVYAGILNVVQTIGELLSGFIAGLVIDNVPSSWGVAKVAMGIGTGGVWGLVAIPFILVLIVRSKTIIIQERRKDGETTVTTDPESSEEDPETDVDDKNL